MNLTSLSIGQRWLSDAEPELGLGVLVEADARAMTVLFPISEETRVYARQQAPLTRIQFSVGDQVTDLDETLWRVVGLHEKDGLLTYEVIDEHGQQRPLSETRLSPRLSLSRPRERLLAARLEAPQWFRLRQAAWRHRLRLSAQDTYGLMGARVALIPHQLYVASQVAQRLAPRVLLADEVGLGKTIEAGLILHALWLKGRCQRALILVPDSLVHQWLVEMRRRFNLSAALLDLARCAAARSQGDNAFQDESLVIAPLSLLVDHPDLREQAQQAGWDLLVVDEAHHLGWTPEEASPEYETVAALAEHIPGLLLLTATPEQLGLESHYARLRLLDPARYASLEAFIDEHDDWATLGTLADHLHRGDITPDIQQQVSAWLDLPMENLDQPAAREAALETLLDRHGLGRVLFRNTRAAVGGFPQRHCHPVWLPAPDSYAPWLAKGAIWPESRVEEAVFLQDDPRIPWLVQWLKQHKREKVLLIMRLGPLAEALETLLRLREGIRTAVFHEEMTLIERDRAAAYFADPESGAQILLCSEIGSEGRNFQFARHLILFDLPDHPDQLEQRIGRLDRIGQAHDIQIHVPLIEDSAQSRLFTWYDQALDVFARCSPAAAVVHEHGLADLKAALKPSEPVSTLQALIEQAQTLRAAFENDLSEGRDRLLELQSCRAVPAQALVQTLAEEEQDERLDAFMQAAWEAFGVHVEDQGQPRSWILQPGEHQLIEHLPGLPDDGLTVTAVRSIALAHEDWGFLTWEHPLTQGVIDGLTAGATGSVQVAVLRKTAVTAGTLLLEAWYQPVCPAPNSLALGRVLTREPMRVLMDERGHDLSQKVAADVLHRQLDVPDIKLGRTVIKTHRDRIEALLSGAERIMAARLDQDRREAMARWQQLEGHETERLVALQRVNRGIRDEEIQAQSQRVVQGATALSQMNWEATAFRLIIAA